MPENVYLFVCVEVLLCTFFYQKLTTALRQSAEGERMTVDFMIKSPQKNVMSVSVLSP